MKPLTETAAPPSTPELFSHEWHDRKCINPERFTVDGMPAGTALSVLLGCDDCSIWRMAYTTGSIDEIELTVECEGFGARSAALDFALAAAVKMFKKNRKAVACLNGLRAALDAVQPGRSPANIADQDAAVPTPEPAEIAVEAIADNPRNERERPKEYIDELAEDIRVNGLMQRIGVVLVVPSGEELPGVPPAPCYRLVYGGCRLKAVRSLKLATIRAEVYPLTLSARHESRLVKAENLKRRNPNPIEEAQGYADHMREFALTQEEMAKEVGKSRPVIANAIRLLDLPPSVLELLGGGLLTIAHGTALARKEFQPFPAVVEFIAKLAAKDKAAAADLEKGLPYAEDLVEKGLAARVDLAKFNYNLPPSLKKHASYLNNNGYNHYLLDVPFYQAAAAEIAADKKEAADKARANQAKVKPSAKTLEDLKGSVMAISKANEEIAFALLPDDSFKEVKRSSYDSEKVTVCTDVVLAKKVDEALNTLRDADRNAKFTPLVEKARKKIGTIKKIGARELTLLLQWALMENYGGTFSASAGKDQGVKLPKLEQAGYRLSFDNLQAIAGCDSVGLFRVLLADKFDGAHDEDRRDGGAGFRIDGEVAALVKWILEVDDFGFLEESKAGRVQLIEAVQAMDWYKSATMKAEVAAAKAKPATPQNGAGAKKKKGKK